MSTLVVSFSTRFHSGEEIKWPQLLDDVSHVVVEVTTHDYRSAEVLPDDVPDDLGHSYRPLLQVLLFSGLEIAVENLNVFVAEFQLSPAEKCPKCLHQLQVGVGSRCIPTSSTAS
jgi:hypothetical protein